MEFLKWNCQLLIFHIESETNMQNKKVTDMTILQVNPIQDICYAYIEMQGLQMK